jgi:hypothetical protein
MSMCIAWSGLRAQYAANVAADSPVQLNEWFSGPAWAAAEGDAGKLGSNPQFTSLEAAWGVATTGDTASAAAAGNVDKACAAG